MIQNAALLFLLSFGLVFASAEASADFGDRVENRLDRRGDRIDRRLDRRGDRIDRRLDRRGQRFDRRFDRRH